MFSDGSNGAEAQPELAGTCPTVERLSIEYYRLTDEMRINGGTASLESALAMLRRAVFEYEMLLRAQRAQRMAAAAVEQAQAAQLADQVRGKLRV